MPTLEIHLEQSPDFDLATILDALEPSACRMHWYFVEFVPELLVGEDGTRNTDPPDWVPLLWREIEVGNKPTILAWDKVRQFARFVLQTDLALLIGLDSGQAPPEPIDLNDPNLALVVQALDGYLWAITTQDASVIKTVQNRFPNAQIVERTQRYY